MSNNLDEEWNIIFNIIRYSRTFTIIDLNK